MSVALRVALFPLRDVKIAYLGMTGIDELNEADIDVIRYVDSSVRTRGLLLRLFDVPAGAVVALCAEGLSHIIVQNPHDRKMAG